MSSNQPNPNDANQPPQRAPGLNAALTESPNQEITLVNLYREITGEDEAVARSTFMFVICENEETNIGPPGLNASDTTQSTPPLV